MFYTARITLICSQILVTFENESHKIKLNPIKITNNNLTPRDSNQRCAYIFDNFFSIFHDVEKPLLSV